MYSDSVGDVPKGSIGGLVHADTRFLSRWQLTINGAPFLVLRGSTVDYYSAEFFLTNPRLDDLEANSVGLRRLRFVGNGLHERLELESYLDEPIRIELRLAVDNDFADLFEIKDKVRDRSDQIVRTPAPDRTGLTFRYTNKSFSAETTIETSAAATKIDGDGLVWAIDLPAEDAGSASSTSRSSSARARCSPCMPISATSSRPRSDDPIDAWIADMPRLATDSHLLGEVVGRTARDLIALRIEATSEGQPIMLPAAGLPWFLTLFGRDTLVTRLPDGRLRAAGLPRERCSRWRSSRPTRATTSGTGARQDPPRAADGRAHPARAQATQPVLRQRRLDAALADPAVRVLALDGRRPSSSWRSSDNALAALAWIDEFGDRDGDGYVEYGTRSSQGLGNQCWRDSYDGVQFADGTIPFLPIATAEIQGYVYDAKLRLAELADGPYADPALAIRLRGEAAALRERFERDFWIEARGGYYAIGLDGDKRPIDSLTSNIGQLLWTGIVSDERAAIVARQLMSDALFSGWGVRTLSTDDEGFNPIGYHRGTVWPHDNSIIAHGLARYGFRDEANRIALAMLDAAAFSRYRLPEAFSGYARSRGRFPVPYPTACSPQAWATGAPLLLLRAMLGLEVRDGQVTVDPALPDEIGWVSISGLRAFGTRWDVEANGRNGHVRLAHGD